ncbi:MAG: class I SAM-dependent methyltransferase [Nitrospirae bacterium]|nr:class I SAM-dependent methyltransferase [Nitrospirota bacterium]
MEMPDDRKINETRLYGANWNAIHGGYFSDLAVAAPLVKVIAEAITHANPHVVADLGGGTGFILQQVAAALGSADKSFIAVDQSAEQLNSVDDRFSTLKLSVGDITRGDLGAAGSSLMFIMRSVLHYFRRDRQREILRHLRRQMNAGESFIHQSACFANAAYKDMWNYLYELMNVDKWFESEAELASALSDEGWRILSITSAPPLHINSAELAERFQLEKDQMRQITENLNNRYSALTGFFVPEDDGFATSLHYKIFKCAAV